MKSKEIRWITCVVFLLVMLAIVSMISLCVGAAGISFKKTILTLFSSSYNNESSILFDIRFPRIILGFAVGGALSLAGVILQGMFRNPLVEPYTLGISGGAALGVSVGISLKLTVFHNITLPLLGFVGAMSIIVIIYLLSINKGILNIQGFLLMGVMISFICSSLVMLIMATSHVKDLHAIVFWVMGSLDEPQMSLIKIMFVVSILGLLISYFFSSDLNALFIGEEEAQHLGIRVEKTKKNLFFVASFLTGTSVAVSGIIGFVGLVVPHFVRLFFGSDYRFLLITSYLVGACFLIICDTIARTIIAPLELPVGVITGILGGSIFIYVLSKKR